MTIRSFELAEITRSPEAVVISGVCEPNEYAVERIHGALLFPLSTFDPHALPDMGNRTIVFQCGSGIRSAKALQQCQNAGLNYECHLKGGIQAWKAAVLPTITVDPDSGAMRDPR